jgi:hypothetical protein
VSDNSVTLTWISATLVLASTQTALVNTAVRLPPGCCSVLGLTACASALVP